MPIGNDAVRNQIASTMMTQDGGPQLGGRPGSGTPASPVWDEGLGGGQTFDPISRTPPPVWDEGLGGGQQPLGPANMPPPVWDEGLGGGQQPLGPANMPPPGQPYPAGGPGFGARPGGGGGGIGGTLPGAPQGSGWAGLPQGLSSPNSDNSITPGQFAAVNKWQRPYG
jgi:translation initiation factor IF-2